MPLSLARRLATGMLTLIVMVTVALAGTTATQAAVPQLALTALSFEHALVDVTQDVAINKLTWTVTNTDPAAQSIHGTVTMRMRSSVTGALIGHDVRVRYEFDDTCCGDAVYESGTPQESTYSYALPVRLHADAAAAAWEVTEVTIGASGTTATVSGTGLQSFGYRFSVVAMVDHSGPTVDSIELHSARRPYFYLGNDPVTVSYRFVVQDWQSGFWKGTIRLAGPGGQSVTTAFTWEREESSTAIRCGSISSADQDSWVQCAIGVTLPAGAAPGSWRIASLVVRNNAGGTTTYKNPTAPSIAVTSNSTVQASGFVIGPNPVNNWRDSVLTELTMSVTGALRGITAVHVDLDGGCEQQNTATVKADGRVAVPVMVYQYIARCEVEGIAVVDGSGKVALYGREFGAPDPELAITRVPNTDAPVAESATLTPSSLPADEVGQRSVVLTVRRQAQVAPVDAIEVHLYDTDNNLVVSESYSGAVEVADGTVTARLPLPWEGLASGAYTVGFALGNAAGMTSRWNMPDRSDSQTLPGGPVVFTVTAG
ncbi:hypothetical protein [Micromonospora sp. RTGN7]|uniref:hypothetical protein n=1 Tax=Micromonospora sp. RTGN7 TaxID=3016526 RepID=UPI0029FF250F|nr:hypothetical protein [Micromonospora sp. RTGN7]